MTIPGRVQNGVVILEGDSTLPEGAVVSVYCPTAAPPSSAGKVRIQLPLVRTGEPGTVHLTNQRIAEILDEEDVAPRR
jgi:hypothetical protein